MNETGYAKINLALHVRSRGADGYHALETIFAFAVDGDVLTVAPSDDLSLAIEGPFAADLAVEPDNLVLRAARALRAGFGITQGAALTLDKRLPIASGIGGGSADAAAALRLLARYWGLPEADPRYHEIARGLGADVPACLLSTTCRGEGRGDELIPLDGADLHGLPLLLVNPRVPVSTGPVFVGWDQVDRGALGHEHPFIAARDGRNDLEAPALRLQPLIGHVLTLLRLQPGVALARMSGSGATCFALFESRAERDAAAAMIAAVQPGWWLMASELR